MSSIRSLSVWSMDRSAEPREIGGADPQILKTLGTPVRRAITRTRQWLLTEQHIDGSWCAELEGDTLTETETILLLAYLGRENSDLARRAANYIVEKQLPEGGWAMYQGGKLAISSSVEAYFALKLTGHDPSAEYMQRAREAILAHGGADAVNSYTRFFLALLGQISYDECPAVPPEIMLLPKWFPINIYDISAWSRTIIVPLSIVSAFQPVREIDPRLGIRELFIREPENWPPLRCPGLKGGTGILSWDRFFRTIDCLWKWCKRHRFLPLRRRAIDAAKKWMLERFQESDGLGAIYPPIVWSLLALKCLGYADDSPEVMAVHEAIGRPGDRRPRKRHRPRATLQIAGLGYRHNASSVIGRRHWQRYSRHSQGNRLAFETADFPARRLGRKSESRAGRMVLRICQCLLSRRRRYGYDSHGPARPFERRAGHKRLAAACPAFNLRNRRLRRRGFYRWNKVSRPSAAASNGSWPCKTTTAAGARSIATTTANFSATSPSPIIMP